MSKFKTQSDIAIEVGKLETNPIAEAVQEKIKELLYDDLEKSDIKDLIKEAYPHFPDTLFEECFANAFCSL